MIINSNELINYTSQIFECFENISRFYLLYIIFNLLN